MTKNLPTSTEFCLNCGSLVTLPLHGDNIECFRCNFKTPLEVTKKSYRDRKDWLEDYKTHLKHGDELPAELETINEEEAPQIEQVCINDSCDSTRCYYYAQQTRSADEGQTVFYRCVKCR